MYAVSNENLFSAEFEIALPSGGKFCDNFPAFSSDFFLTSQLDLGFCRLMEGWVDG
jgi:hypothetical protein